MGTKLKIRPETVETDSTIDVVAATRLYPTETWTRPSDWPEMPSVLPSEQKVVILHAVHDADANLVRLDFTGDYTVDWGDGVVENFAGNNPADHNYNYSTLSSNVTSLGYKTATIIVTPQVGNNFTFIRLNRAPPVTGQTTATFITGFLDIIVSAPFCTNLDLAYGAPMQSISVLHKNLQRFSLLSSAVTVASSWFINCTTLSSVPTLNLASCSNTHTLFAGCTSLKEVENVTLGAIETTRSMFDTCISLETAPEMNTTSLVYATSMFVSCTGLKNIPNYDLRNASDVSSMFSACTGLRYVPDMQFANCNTCASMFATTSNLKKVGRLSFTGTGNTSLSSMFSQSGVEYVELLDCRSAVTLQFLFSNATKLKKIGQLANTGNVTNWQSAFSTCLDLLKAPDANTSSGTNFSQMFQSCPKLRTVPAYDFRRTTTLASTFTSCTDLEYVPFFELPLITTTQSMFDGCTNLVSVGGLGNTANLVTVSSMFNNCKQLESVPLFNTSRVTSTQSMFNGCQKLINLPTFDFSNCRSFLTTFASCLRLETVPPFILTSNTLSYISMQQMFQGCRTLQKVPDEWATYSQRIRNISNMFSGCTMLQRVPSWNIANVTSSGNTSSAFNTCYNLNDVELTGIRTSISFTGTRLGPNALNLIYTNLMTVGSGNTITVSSTPGSASDNTAIATAKGWTVA